MSPHSDSLSWFWANQSLLFLLNVGYLAEKQQIPSLVFDFVPTGAWTHDLPHSSMSDFFINFTKDRSFYQLLIHLSLRIYIYICFTYSKGLKCLTLLIIETYTSQFIICKHQISFILCLFLIPYIYIIIKENGPETRIMQVKKNST